MAKRNATSELNDRNWDEEEEDEEVSNLCNFVCVLLIDRAKSWLYICNFRLLTLATNGISTCHLTC